jgi:hypothetical protein
MNGRANASGNARLCYWFSQHDRGADPDSAALPQVFSDLAQTGG